MNEKFRAGFLEHTGLLPPKDISDNPGGKDHQLPQHTTQSFHCQSHLQPPAAEIFTACVTCKFRFILEALGADHRQILPLLLNDLLDRLGKSIKDW